MQLIGSKMIKIILMKVLSDRKIIYTYIWYELDDNYEN